LELNTMQRNFFRGLLICLIPCLLATVFAIRPDKYRLGIDLAGGTILVYEINLERTKQRLAALGQNMPQTSTSGEAGLDSEQMNLLAHQIKRRIDPTDIKNVTVRPLGSTRFEIILPTGGASGGKANLSTEDIEEVKRLISQMGVLEFRILANGVDDLEGIQAARAAVDNKPPADLKAAAAKGVAPDGPEGEFNVEIGETRAKVKYVWAELGPEERESLQLSNQHEGQGALWNALAAQRGKTVPVRATSDGYVPITDNQGATMVLYSRVSESVDQLAKEAAEKERIKRENPGISDEEAEKQVNRKKVEYFALTRVSPEDSLRVGEGGITLTASAGTDRSFNPSVDFVFNGAGAQQFGKITRRNKPSGSMERHLAILLDDRIVSAPSLKGEITSHGQITGKFDRKSVDRLVQILRSGALNAELREKPVSENTIGPTLGRDTIRKGTMAVGLAFLAILAFMIFYYRFAGLVASIALFANLLLTVGFMVAVNAAFTLPGLAGLVLTLGMAVDANVLIYERLREERDKGANLATAIRNGYDRAFLTIIDTHLTSIFTAIVLYTFGNDQLKGFAISLTVGLVISLFTSLYMTRLMFDYWMHKKWLTELKMLRFFGKLNLHPMKYRWFFLPFTAALTVLGLALFLYRDEDALNVDFRGGTVFAGKLKDGEERALTKTGDGKAGFRELLSPEHQAERLTAVRATRENLEGRAETANIFVYTITYAEPDGRESQSIVTLTQKPQGDTEEEMAEDVVRRARRLPDVSVEQMFLSGEDYPDGKSRYFTIRTTEKQPELVRASLNRLLRDEGGNSLMTAGTVTYPVAKVKDAKGNELSVPVVANGAVELEFSKPTSRAYVQELLEREFRTALRVKVDSSTFNLTGVGEAVEGRFTRMKLDVSKNPNFDKLAAAKPDPADAAVRSSQLSDLALVLEGTKRAFESTPEPERLEVFDSQLAAETRTKAFYAILASWIAILLYLWFRFGNWTFGLAAVLCLVHDLCFTLGAIAVCHYLYALPGMNLLGIQDFKIDLAAVAALLTLVGYSVNEIIVNFARIREVRGKDPKLTPQMINTSVSQTLSRTILTSTTVLLVSIVLYVFGGEGVHLFAFVMMMGVLISTYSSIFVASPLLLVLGEGREETAEAAATEEPAEKDDKEEEEVVGG
jgi:SecD/SecF fusion protein